MIGSSLPVSLTLAGAGGGGEGEGGGGDGGGGGGGGGGDDDTSAMNGCTGGVPGKHIQYFALFRRHP